MLCRAGSLALEDMMNGGVPADRTGAAVPAHTRPATLSAMSLSRDLPPRSAEIALWWYSLPRQTDDKLRAGNGCEGAEVPHDEGRFRGMGLASHLSSQPASGRTQPATSSSGGQQIFLDLPAQPVAPPVAMTTSESW